MNVGHGCYCWESFCASASSLASFCCSGDGFAETTVRSASNYREAYDKIAGRRLPVPAPAQTHSILASWGDSAAGKVLIGSLADFDLKSVYNFSRVPISDFRPPFYLV